MKGTKTKKSRYFEQTVYTTAEAISVLEISEKEFYRRKAQPDTKMVRSKVNGKFFVIDVLDEYERIHGRRKEDVLVS